MATGAHLHPLTDKLLAFGDRPVIPEMITFLAAPAHYDEHCDPLSAGKFATCAEHNES